MDDFDAGIAFIVEGHTERVFYSEYMRRRRRNGSWAALFRQECPAGKREATRRSEEMEKHPATSKVG